MKKNGAAKQKIAVSVLMAGLGTWSFGWLVCAPGNRLGYTNSIVSVFVFIGLLLLFERVFEREFSGRKSLFVWPGIFGALFSFCMVWGAVLDDRGSIPFADASMWITILAVAVTTTVLVRYAWELLSGSKNARGSKDGKIWDAGSENAKGAFSAKSWALTAGVILLCYVPVFLAVYPGFFVYDAMEEWNQVAMRAFTTHHPLAHVLLLGGTVQVIHKLTGSYNAGIAVYTVLQMAVMAGIFAYCAETLKKRGLAKTGRILVTLYFGLCPVLVMYSLCSAKDGLFTGLLLLLFLMLQNLCRQPEVFFAKKTNAVLLVLAAAGMMLLRHNGLYAFLVFIPFLARGMRKYLKRVLLCAAAAVLLSGAVFAGLAGVLHADASENQEILTVPIMQLARVYRYEKESFTEKEKESLLRFLPEDALENYTPKLSDMVKFYFDNAYFKGHKGEFFKLWLSQGIRHPAAYLNAWFMTSYGFWYPDTVIDVYRGNPVFTYTYEDSSYFGYETEQPGERDSKLPWLDEFYRKLSLEIYQQKVPVLSMLFSPGFMVWALFFALGFFCYTGRFETALPYLLIVLCWLTVIVGPTYLVRYVVYLWAIAPVLLWDLAGCCAGRRIGVS